MSKDKIFSISVVNKEGKEIGSAVLPPSKRYLTIGEGLDNDISVSIPGIPDRHRLLENTRSRYALIIPKSLDGIIYRDNEKGFIHTTALIKRAGLEKKKDSYIIPFTPGRSFSLKAGDITLSFSYQKVPPRGRSAGIERSLRKSLISRDDYPFLFLLLILVAINFSAAGYLNTIEVIKIDHIEALQQMPERFARLIFKPAERKIEKKMVKPKAEEKKEEEKAEKKQEEAKKEVKKESKTKIAAAKEPSAKESIDSAGSRVKSKGLLGVITAKQKPVFASQNLFDVDTEYAPRIPKIASLQQGTKGGDSAVQRLDNIDLGSGDHKPVTKTRDIAEILKEKKVASVGPATEKTGEKVTTALREESDVYRTIFSYTGGVRYLYNNALREDPTLKGKVTVKLTISEEGKAVKVEMVSSTLKKPELEEAIMNRIYKWQFSEAKGSGDFVITYTFDFSPTS